MRILVTGGAGFIGANFVAHLLAHGAERVVVLDALTYAGNLQNLIPAQADPRYRFVKGSILDRALVEGLLASERLDAVANLAAESHVDRSIRGQEAFVETNVTGTLRMLEASRAHVETHPELRGRFGVIAVNAPYVPTDAIAMMPPEARLHEPTVALDGGEDGLDIHRRVAAAAGAWLAPGGTLLIEAGDEQAAVSAALFSAAGLSAHVESDDERGATIVVAERRS